MDLGIGEIPVHRLLPNREVGQWPAPAREPHRPAPVPPAAFASDSSITARKRSPRSTASWNNFSGTVADKLASPAASVGSTSSTPMPIEPPERTRWTTCRTVKSWRATVRSDQEDGVPLGYEGICSLRGGRTMQHRGPVREVRRVLLDGRHEVQGKALPRDPRRNHGREHQLVRVLGLVVQVQVIDPTMAVMIAV